MKSKIQISIIFLAIFCTAFLLLTWFTIRLINSTEDKIISSLEIELARFERNFTDRMDYTFLMMRNINLRIAENPQDKNYINQILRNYHPNQTITNSFAWSLVSWMNNNYKLIVNSKDGILKTPIDVSLRSYILMTEREPNTFQIEPPVVGLSTKKWVIPSGVGILDNNGKYLGATIVGFDIEALAKLLHKVIQNPEVKFSVFGKNEVPILYGDYKSYGIDEFNDDAVNNVKIGRLLNEIYSQKSIKISDISLFFNRHAFLVKQVDGYPYVLLFEYDKNAILKELFYTASSRLLEISSIFFGLIILLVLIYREKQQTEKILHLKQVAEQANETKTEFLIKAAHEFKNFVFGIQGCAEIIRKDLKELFDNLKKEEKLNKNYLKDLEVDVDLSRDIVDASHELDGFLNDLIDVNHGKNDLFKIKRNGKATDVKKIINQAINSLKKRAKNADIILIPKIDENLRKVSKLDPHRIKQVISNLIGNAIKYSPSGAVVEIIANNINDKNEITKIYRTSGIKKINPIQIIIKDHGVGMTEKEVKESLQNIKKGSNNPLALGLPALKYLIEKQGGIFEIKSQKNHGSEIKIIL